MIKNVLIGIAFAALWSSAGTASKIGILSVEPLVLTNIRFFLAMALMLSYAHFIQKKRLPKGKEWQQLAIYGFLNVTVYLGFFFIAMKSASESIFLSGELAVPFRFAPAVAKALSGRRGIVKEESRPATVYMGSKIKTSASVNAPTNSLNKSSRRFA